MNNYTLFAFNSSKMKEISVILIFVINKGFYQNESNIHGFKTIY